MSTCSGARLWLSSGFSFGLKPSAARGLSVLTFLPTNGPIAPEARKGGWRSFKGYLIVFATGCALQTRWVMKFRLCYRQSLRASRLTCLQEHVLASSECSRKPRLKFCEADLNFRTMGGREGGTERGREGGSEGGITAL